MMSWPIFDALAYENISKQINNDFLEKRSSMKVSFIGCDTSDKQLNNFWKNLEILELNGITNYIQSGDPNVIKLGTPYAKILQKERALWLIQNDFEDTEQKFIKNIEGYDIITNLPFGRMSEDQISKNKLSDIYSKFDRFLMLKKDILGEIYVIYPKKPLSRNHYIAESVLDWK